MMKYFTYEERAEIYEAAIEKFGIEAQAVVAIEELSECAKELCKVLRGKGNPQNLAEELADATIMLEQMRIAMGLNEETKAWMNAKLVRLRHNIRPTVSQEVADEHLENLA